MSYYHYCMRSPGGSSNWKSETTDTLKHSADAARLSIDLYTLLMLHSSLDTRSDLRDTAGLLKFLQPS